MIPLVGFVASIALGWGPNHAALTSALERGDTLERRLVPIEQVIAGAGPLWIVEHDRAELDPLFVPAMAWDAPTRRAAAAWLVGADRLLPELAVPRLALSRQRYALDGFVLDHLAVDVYEPLVRALVDAQLDRRMADEPAFVAAVRSRAEARMTDVAAAHRPEAFLGAVSDYAAQLVAVAHEIARQERRRLERGDPGLCALLDHPVTLFGHWRKLVTEAAFPGYAPAADAPGADRASRSPWLARTRLTRTVLSADDKQWVARTVLDRDWTGDPEVDFAVLCAVGR